ncbi:MAG: right-handed parallel beta-helix repeat-containing protein [Phycisphaerae bacterium]|nr:right-handed parallel beta-helix repeat-containing protein [Phycisphaerae bacterium]
MSPDPQNLPCIEALEGRLLLAGNAVLDALAGAQDVRVAPTASVTLAGLFGSTDGYKFTASATGKVRVDLLDTDASLVVLRNQAGKEISKITNKTKGSTVTISVKAGETYTIAPDVGNGKYTICLTSIPNDDLDNTIDTPKFHKASGKGEISFGGTVDYEGDHDYYAFVATVSGWMTMTLACDKNTTLAPAVRVTDNSGAVIARGSARTGDTASVTFYAVKGVAYTLDIGAADRSTGKYKLVGKTTPEVLAKHVPSEDVNTKFIDRDGDGYGVGSPKGPDADDNDPNVNTYASALKKYGSDLAILTHRYGFSVQRIIYVAPNGNDATGVIGDASKPFASAARAVSLAKPGDAVIFRAGTYKPKGTHVIALNHLQGTKNAPIVIAGMPGERVILDTAGGDGASIDVDSCGWVVIDNFLLDNTGKQGMGRGMNMKYSHDVLVTHTESRNHFWGVIAMQGLKNITWDNMVVHSNSGEHGMYIGARELPNSNITISNSVIYGNNWQGIQLNGRITNARIENNVVHSNGQVGIQFIQGVCKSLVSNNLIFNNGKQAIVLYMYDSSDPNIAPYNQTDNVFEYNTIWVGQNAPPGGEWSPNNYDAVLFNDSTAARKSSLAKNTFRNNVIVTSGGAAFKYTDAQWAGKTNVSNNLVFRTGGDSAVLKSGTQTLAANKLNNGLGGSWKNNVYADPLFANVKPIYSSTPEQFDFHVLATTPIKKLGFQGV